MTAVAGTIRGHLDRCVRAQPSHAGDETVAALRDGLDDGCLGRVSEQLAQRRDVVRERGLADEHIGPHGLKEGVLRNEASVRTDQHRERIEQLRGNRHRYAVTREPALGYIEAEDSEFVHFFRRRIHRSLLCRGVPDSCPEPLPLPAGAGAAATRKHDGDPNRGPGRDFRILATLKVRQRQRFAKLSGSRRWHTAPAARP
jgi:hypothetical protein